MTTQTRNLFAGMPRRTTQSSNPFAAMRGQNLAIVLHPTGVYHGTVRHARLYNSDGTGALTIELQIQTDHDLDAGFDRVLYKRFSFHPNAIAYTAQFFESIGEDIEELGERASWSVDELIGRRVEVTVVHTRFGNQPRHDTGLVQGTEMTLEEERILQALADGIDPETGVILSSEDEEVDEEQVA